jgi:hypothetical protein
MAKKCIPGVICIENMTLFILLVAIGLVVYLIYNQRSPPEASKIIYVQPPTNTLMPVPTRSTDSINDLYIPPLKTNGYLNMPQSTIDIRGGVPINIETRGTGMNYQQIGILTPSNGDGGADNLILPLMGRKLMNGRDKWQYYTVANGAGTIHAKLPVSINGKSCTGEYGCDDIQNGSTVYVEGYKSTFIATVYENNNFSYIPYI